MKPTILMLPGLSGTSTLMQWLAPYLEERYQLVLAELPVSISHKDQTYDILCNHIEDTYFNQLTSSQCWVLGESFSGPLAIMLAKRHPKKISGVILAATFITCPNQLAKKLQKLLFALLPIHFGREKMGALFLAGTDLFQASPIIKRELSLALSATPTQTLIERLSTVITCDLRPLFPLAQPALYLQAKRDWIVQNQALKTIQIAQPNLKSICLDAPHLILQFKPQESASAIEQFILENSL
ncbi:MAG: alpha/beta fold hydrolase [Saezia sp.]